MNDGDDDDDDRPLKLESNVNIFTYFSLKN